MIVSFLTTYIFIINYYRYEVNIFSSTTIFCIFGYLERAYTDGSDAEAEGHQNDRKMGGEGRQQLIPRAGHL